MNLVKIPKLSKDDIEARDKLIENLQTKNQILAIWLNEEGNIIYQYINMNGFELLGELDMVKHAFLKDYES